MTKPLNLQVKKQILAWLKGKGVKAIAVLKVTGHCVVYQLELSYKKGCTFVPKAVLVDKDSETFEVLRYSDRTKIMVKHLKRPGKGGRTAFICNVYMGTYCLDDAVDLVKELKRNSFNSKIRVPERVKGYRIEVALRGDFHIDAIAAYELAIARLERRPLKETA